MIIPPHSYSALLYLGSDGSIRFKRCSGPKTRQGEITVQHGDVVGVKSGPESIELLLKLDGFGFSRSQPLFESNLDINMASVRRSTSP